MALPRVIIEVGFTGPTLGTELVLGDGNRGLVNTGTLGDDNVWQDITPYVRSWTCRRGATRADGLTLRYEAGTATIELNNGDRRFDPTNSDSPYVQGGYTQLVPMVRVRVRAVWNNEVYPLFSGFADQWQVSYQATSWSTVTLTASDAFKVFTAYQRSASSAVGSGEKTGVRINRILDQIGWDPYDRVIDTGDISVQSTTLEGDALTEMQLVQDTELGDLYVDGNGYVTFKSRTSIQDYERSVNSQALFGDGGYAETDELPYADVTVETDDQGMANLITIARAGGTEQVVENVASRAKYLTKTFQRNDLLFTTDAAALTYAQRLLYLSALPEIRFGTLSLVTPQPQVEDVMWPMHLGLLFGDRITTTRRPPGGGSPITMDSFIRGVAYESDGQSWKTDFTLQSAARFSFFIIGDDEQGLIGQNALGF